MRILLLTMALIGLAGPAAAQNAGQIARVKAGAGCPRCNLFQADLAGANLRGRNFSGARLRQADLSSVLAGHARFAGGDLRDLNAYGATMGGADFARTDLTNATFVGAYLVGANFAGAHLDGTNFSGAEMARARGLTRGQLAAACGDASTALPPGLRLKPCN